MVRGSGCLLNVAIHKQQNFFQAHTWSTHPSLVPRLSPHTMTAYCCCRVGGEPGNKATHTLCMNVQQNGCVF